MSEENGSRTRASRYADDQMELLMRHSSPLIRNNNVGSPLVERNGSPSPLRMTRPTSNPRNRTPMRYTSPLAADAFRIPEETNGAGNNVRQEGRRITIRPMAGRAVGTTMRGTRDSQPNPTGKSLKQGPSHRKQRRWNNDNFVNLASELHSGSGKQAAQALLLGHADASKYRSFYNPEDHKSKTMTKFLEDDTLAGVRDKFFEGEVPVPRHQVQPSQKDSAAMDNLTPEQMLHRMDARLRRVVVKACENSNPATQVMEILEKFLVRAYKGKSDKTVDWSDILMEPPTVTHRKRDDSYVTRFWFDSESSAGGFHRLLLHGLCQYHGLQATSSTVEVTVLGKPKQARLLTATGKLSGANINLVDYIMQRQEMRQDQETTKLAFEMEALKV